MAEWTEDGEPPDVLRSVLQRLGNVRVVARRDEVVVINIGSRFLWRLVGLFRTTLYPMQLTITFTLADCPQARTNVALVIDDKKGWYAFEVSPRRRQAAIAEQVFRKRVRQLGDSLGVTPTIANDESQVGE
jgi:hypothetical protein